MFLLGHQSRLLTILCRQIKTKSKKFNTRRHTLELKSRIKMITVQEKSNFIDPGLSRIQPQNFDFFLVLDFEATCDFHSPPDPQEIIEFPCLKVSAKTFETESIFHQYVRPVVHPIISDFCSDLTGIIQEMLDDQPNLTDTLNRFHSWLIGENLLEENVNYNENEPFRFAFVTCGDWDLQSMLPREASKLSFNLPPYFAHWINIKKPFAKVVGSYPRGFLPMLSTLGIEHVGRHHSGIDDCRNIVRILSYLAKKGVVYKHTNSSLL